MRSAWSEKELRDAITRNEIVIHYQPQFNLVTNKYGGLEALVRWQKGGTLISPDDFLPGFVRYELMHVFSLHLLHLVLSHIRSGVFQEAGVEKISINLSYNELSNPDFIDEMLRILKLYDVDPSMLVVELTESSNIDDLSFLSASIKKLKSIGVGVSLDDFCTGCSCLNHLRMLDVDAIKIDKSFIHNISESQKDYLIVQCLIDIARQLGVETVVEGVEYNNQKALIERFEPTWLQGYYLARPMAIEECLLFLQSHHADNNLYRMQIA